MIIAIGWYGLEGSSPPPKFCFEYHRKSLLTIEALFPVFQTYY